MDQQQQVIVVGGGLSGLSTAHSAIQSGARVVLIERNPFCGGNSTKATSGINGTPTAAQKAKGIPDNTETFLRDTVLGANKGDVNAVANDLQKVMVHDSGPAIEWLINNFGLDLSLVSRLGGHSHPRTHRGKEKFPGMTITYALMEKFDAIEAETKGQKAKLINKARVVELIVENGEVVGVKYEKNKQLFTERGQVVIATGGYGADFASDSLLKQFRPDLMQFPTTNGDHCNGNGIKMSQKIGADVVDMEWVQVHPTGLVNVKDPENKIKFLAAEALRGCGGIMIDANGDRFCDELGRRDYVTGEMLKGKGPFRLILNSAASKEIEWHCKHYVGRGLMHKFGSGADLAKDMKIPVEKLTKTFQDYNVCAKEGKDKYGKRFFTNAPFNMNDNLNVSFVTPVIHYTMGGIRISADNRVLDKNGNWVKGLWAVGETVGGVHGKNRLGGNSLLDCVVHGRVAGKDAVKYYQTRNSGTQDRLTQVATQLNQSQTTGPKQITADEIAQHNSEHDCWVSLYGEVYNVTKFLDDHPGGKDSIMLFAGKDATEQFDMLHQKVVLEKHGKDLWVGKLSGKPKL